MNETEKRLLELISKKPLKSSEIVAAFEYKMFTGSLRKGLERLEDLGLAALTIPKPSSKNLQRMITKKGLGFLKSGLEAQDKNFKVG